MMKELLLAFIETLWVMALAILICAVGWMLLLLLAFVL